MTENAGENAAASVAADVVADVAVIGGGIAGASVAANLAPHTGVVLVEREPTLAHHTTGRSAAAFLESLGGPAVRALTVASRAELESASEDGETPSILTTRGVMWMARAGEEASLDRLLADVPSLQRLDERVAAAMCPVLRPGYAVAGAYEPNAADIDVLGLHGHYIRRARRAGAVVCTNANVVHADALLSGWRLTLSDGTRVRANLLVDAAGAWSDRIAVMAGARAVGLRPLRRTIAIGRPSGAVPDASGPFVCDVAETFYCKPEGPNVLASPADETPSEPCDARPEEIDVAMAIDRVNEATTYDIRSVVTAWSGLRTFAPDRGFVVGFDPDVPRLFWVAGQGGYGIQTSAALARLCAALIIGDDVPPDLVALGLDVASMSPSRFR